MSKIKKPSKIIPIIIGIIIFLGSLVVIKMFYFNPPKETPQQITQKIIDFMQKKETTDKDKENIRKYYKASVLDKFDKDISDTKSEDNSSNKDIVVTIKSVEEQKNTATATIEMEAWILKVPIQFKFVKDGNFWKGYNWMIEDIIGIGDSSSANKKESAGKAGDKLDIGGNFSLIVSSLSDYTPSSSWDKPDDGMKFVSTELTYFNSSNQSDSVNPTNLTLRDSEGHSYEITYKTEKKPQIEIGTVVTVNSSAKGFVVYEIPTSANITNAVYSNSDSTITINF